MKIYCSSNHNEGSAYLNALISEYSKDDPDSSPEARIAHGYEYARKRLHPLVVQRGCNYVYDAFENNFGYPIVNIYVSDADDNLIGEIFIATQDPSTDEERSFAEICASIDNAVRDIQKAC